jgi:large subunit ribosomal protein L3
MPTRKSPRKGSLQFWPRKRARKILPSVNWTAINTDSKIKGLICYKAGMFSAAVKDNTEHSMTKGKEIVIPATVLECPAIKIFSVRFYKNNKPVKEVLAENLDKELKKRIKLPKKKTSDSELDKIKTEEYDDIRILAYSLAKTTKIKKAPDMVEIGLGNMNSDEKLGFVKEYLKKEINPLDFFKADDLVDFRGLTKGKGLQGPVKRFGITLKSHKSEKGRRNPGSIGPWHPARVTFRVPMAGQLGMFTRVSYNHKIVDIGKAEELKGKSKKMLSDIKNYGKIRTNYIIVAGSVQGAAKRPLVLTSALRKTKKTEKKKYDFKELR